MESIHWATLGGDDELVHVVRWMVGPQSADHVVLGCAAGSSEAALRSLAPRAAWETSWEPLLSARQVQAVLVARSDFPGRRDALRELASTVPMLLMFPAGESIFACQLEMICREHAICLLPYVPQVFHPAVEQLAGLMIQGKDSPIGDIEQIVVERTAGQRTNQRVLELFANDAILLQSVGGRIEQLGALGESAGEPDFSRVSIHLKMELGPLARWSIHPGQSKPGGRLILIGQLGVATVEMESDPSSWTLTIGQDVRSFSDWVPERAMLEYFRRSIQEPSERLNWSHAYRALEAAEAIETSCRRGRVVEFYGRTVTEETTFKGMMAAGGCFLIMAALAVVFVVLVVDALQLPLRQWWLWRQWPWLLLVPFFAFLLLQGLQFVFPAAGRSTPVREETDR